MGGEDLGELLALVAVFFFGVPVKARSEPSRSKTVGLQQAGYECMSASLAFSRPDTSACAPRFA